MQKKYFLNTKTGKLHISGYCRESGQIPIHVVWFDTYDEALAYDGRAVGFCKNCQKKEAELNKQKS